MDEIRKATFIFNLEWAEVLTDFPAEVRLETYEAIIRYASSGTVGELKPQAKIAFAFIKREMDYNTRQYEAKLAQCREAGRKGAAATNGESRRKSASAENAENKSGESRRKSASAENAENKSGESRRKSAKSGIYDIDNDIIYSSSTTQNIARESPRNEGAVFLADESFLAEYLSKATAVESFCMANGVTVEEFRAVAAEVVNEWQLIGKVHSSPQDAAAHLTNQSRIKITKRKQDNGNSINSGLSAQNNLAECGAAIHRKLTTPDSGDDIDLSGDY